MVMLLKSLSFFLLISVSISISIVSFFENQWQWIHLSDIWFTVETLVTYSLENQIEKNYSRRKLNDRWFSQQHSYRNIQRNNYIANTNGFSQSWMINTRPFSLFNSDRFQSFLFSSKSFHTEHLHCHDLFVILLIYLQFHVSIVSMAVKYRFLSSSSVILTWQVPLSLITTSINHFFKRKFEI